MDFENADFILRLSLAPERFAAWELRYANAAGNLGLPVAGEGWIAYGDAAASIDPIVSQGLLNAIRTGAAAAEILRAADRSAAISKYRDEIFSVWETYVRRRVNLYGRLRGE